ncbi:MAG: IS1096 element passenger TnpR family protein [Polaribacter sp.]
MYKIRIILDTPEDVIRTILIDNTSNLEDLHNYILTSFGFNPQELASFYRTDNEWHQGQEIPLCTMEETHQGISMHHFSLLETLPKENDKLIYLYDFLKMWTFYVEVIEISSDKMLYSPKTIFSVGKIPSEAPKKEFKAETLEDLFHDTEDDFDFFDDFDSNDY